MRESDSADPLLVALSELSVLADRDGQAALAELRGRLTDQRLRVLVAGEAKRGKSTLINALLGRPVLPVGVTPLTALAATVRYGTDECVRVLYRDGRRDQLPLTALGDLVTEHGNPRNRRDVASVTVAVNAPILQCGAELVDTPGTGSVYAHNTTEAETALESMDAAVLVLTADSPASASERDLMTRVAELSMTMFVVLNKADYLAAPGAGEAGPGRDGQSELGEAVGFAARIAAEAIGHPVRVYPVSARAAMADGDAGFAVFASDLAGYLRSGRAHDLRLSVAGHARRLARLLLDEVDLTRRAAEMRSEEAAGRVQAFRARLEAAARRRQDATDLAAAESARMLADLNEAAGLAADQLTADVDARLSTLASGDLRTAPPAQIERDGRARLAELAVAVTEAWRQQRAEELERRLADLDRRLTGDLRAELEAVRGAAAELLGLTLSVPAPAGRLVPDLRFFYLVAEDAGQTELLAGAIRRRLPGEAGRRRAREYLRRETAALVPRQVGRARADLQYRLAEATRRLGREISARYADSTGRLENALKSAAAQRAATAADAPRRDDELASRQEAFHRVLALLSAPAAGAGTPRSAAGADPPGGDQSPYSVAGGLASTVEVTMGLVDETANLADGSC